MRRNKKCRPIETISDDGNVIEYSSVIDASLSTKCGIGTIYYYLKKYPHFHRGYQWKYKDQDIPGTVWVNHPTLNIQCSKDGRIKFPTGRITMGTIWNCQRWAASYYTVGVEHKIYKVHRLIAETFIPNLDNKPTVDHIDRNGLNNHVSNLRWATPSEQNNNRSNPGPYVRRIKKK
jgi:hypothetical protein